MNFEEEYKNALAGLHGRDMYEHLPWLSDYAKECKHITEFGVGWGESTRTFMNHDVELHSYEFAPQPGIRELFDNAKEAGRNVTLHIDDIRAVTIEDTDLLLVDSLHSYNQVKIELELHSKHVKKYIFFHDTTTFADYGQENDCGIWPAISEFLESTTEWEMVERRTNNNGMTLIKRVDK